MSKDIYVGRLISEESLSHSLGPWKKHKYVKKVGDRYYYNKLTKSAKDLAARSDNEKANAEFYEGYSKAKEKEAIDADRKLDKYTEKLNDRRADERTREIYRGLQADAAETRHRNANDAANFKRIAERRQKRADTLSRISAARQSQAERMKKEKSDRRKAKIKQRISSARIRGKNFVDGIVKKVTKR